MESGLMIREPGKSGVRLEGGHEGRPYVSAWHLAELTTEQVAYAGITILALGVRLWGLGWWPLGPAEAAQAVPAVSAAAGLPHDLTGISPLLSTLQRLIFTPFGATEALARWWPALLGGLSPLLFYALRDRLTRGGALVAALLWAISPMGVFVGRSGTAIGLVPVFALALLAGLNTALLLPENSTGSRRTLGAAGVALGLLLSSGKGAYTVIVILLVAAAWRRESWSALRILLRDGWRWLVVGFLSAFVLGSTFFWVSPAGLASAADLLGDWLGGLRPGNGDYTAWDVVRRLLISESSLVGFGLGGLVLALRRGDRFGQLAGAAAGLALLVSLVGRGRHPGDLGLVALALALLAGPALAETLRNAWSWRRELDPGLLVALSLVLLLAAALCLPSAVNPSNTADWRALYTGVGIVTATLTALLWLVYGVWGSWDVVRRALPVVPLVLLLAWNVGQLSELSYDRGAGRRAAVLVEMPSANLYDLRVTLAGLSALIGGGARATQVDLVLSSERSDPLEPMLRWELRHLTALRVLTRVPSDPAAVVLTVAEGGQDGDRLLPLGERYSGANFTVLERWRPDSMKQAADWLRWILYREATTAPEPRDVILWVDRSAN